MQDASGTTTYGYDSLGRVDHVTQPANKTITYSYDPVGSRSAMLDPDGGCTTYSYDAANRLTSLLNPFSERTTWVYDALSRASTLTLANGAVTTYAYDAAGRLTLLRNAKSDGTTISSFEYGNDSVGNRTGVLEANGDRVTWSYDALYQLTRERRSGANAYDITYSYDPVGNRVTKVASGVSTTYSYDAANELTIENAAGTVTTYSYDANGNTTVKNAAGSLTTYTWEGENRLSKIESGDGVLTMTYDADGLRRKKQDSSATAKFIWDGQKVLLETDAQGSTVVGYTLSDDVYGDLVSQRRSGASRFFHFDALGSTDRLTDANAGVTDSYTYYAFGQQRASSGTTTNPYRYVGRLGYYSNGTGALYLRARYYQGSAGRFLSADPLGAAWNRYAYGRSDPVNYIDPPGLLCIHYGPYICIGIRDCSNVPACKPKKPKPKPKPECCDPEAKKALLDLADDMAGEAAGQVGGTVAKVAKMVGVVQGLSALACTIKNRDQIRDVCLDEARHLAQGTETDAEAACLACCLEIVKNVGGTASYGCMAGC